jgi:hypothetical protein
MAAISLKHSLRLESTWTQSQRLFQTDCGPTAIDTDRLHPTRHKLLELGEADIQVAILLNFAD